jgi:hypothetical protein
VDLDTLAQNLVLEEITSLERVYRAAHTLIGTLHHTAIMSNSASLLATT